MAIEYNNIYYQIEKRPSPKNIMVAVPLYMYRIESNEFEHGLNFFQKLVLKFKAKPGIKNETISEYTNLDTKLIEVVSSELQNKKLITEYGSLSEMGKEVLNEVDGLVVNSGKKTIGYVFKYVDKGTTYQYYIGKVFPADIRKDIDHPQIIIGTKGEGDDRYETPFYLDCVLKNKTNQNRPTERDVLHLIQNTNKKALSSEVEYERAAKLSNQLCIRFLNEQPEVVWACTYIYLQQNEDGSYQPDWRVLDPFGYGDNVALKFYFSNNSSCKKLLEKIQNEFAEAKILDGKIFSDYQERIDKLVENKILSDFPIAFNYLDNNLQIYLKTILKEYILLQESNTNENIDSSVSFILTIQKALENILKTDREQRQSAYNQLYSLYEPDPKTNDSKGKYQALIDIYHAKIFSQNTRVQKKLLNTTKARLSSSHSLLQYLVAFILTYNYDNKPILFKLLNNRIDLIIEIAQQRNEKGHGQTENEKKSQSLSKENIEKYYEFIKSFINDYIEKKNHE